MTSYTHMTFDGAHPDRFPPPQLWLVWTSDDDWNSVNVPNPHFDDTKPADYSKNPEQIYVYGVLKSKKTGKVRHQVDLPKAKRMVAGYCRHKFTWEGGTPVYHEVPVQKWNRETQEHEPNGTQTRFKEWRGGRLVEHKKPAFSVDWKIFEWVDGEWVVRYEGKRGDVRAEHPLWEKIGRKQKIRATTGLDDQEAYARKVAEASLRALGAA